MTLQFLRLGKVVFEEAARLVVVVSDSMEEILQSLMNLWKWLVSSVQYWWDIPVMLSSCCLMLYLGLFMVVMIGKISNYAFEEFEKAHDTSRRHDHEVVQ